MRRDEINIRDPFVLVFDEQYYLYGTRGPVCQGADTGFDVYVSKDLENWNGPSEVFRRFSGFWADSNFWAPEVHYYKESFYMFASFKAKGVCRGTQILKADHPDGQFVPLGDRPVTPENWECLDGTLYVQNGTPYLVFCHEWEQVGDGEICAVQLSEDLKQTTGEPVLLFRASEAPWVRSIKDKGNFVTDGPFLYRCENSALLMLWSSFGEGGYTLAAAVSDNGEINGAWRQCETPIFQKDGGHGMVFRDLSGKLRLSLHSPNKAYQERPCFYELTERDNWLFLK